jgi:hypothetical protein
MKYSKVFGKTFLSTLTGSWFMAEYTDKHGRNTNRTGNVGSNTEQGSSTAEKSGLSA